MKFTCAHLMQAFSRLNLPLVIGLALALPLAACGKEGGNDAATSISLPIMAAAFA